MCNNHHLKAIGWAAITIVALLGMQIFATSSGGSGEIKDIGSMAGAITNTFENIVKLIAGASYIAGFVFSVVALFKFKQHKENPQQVQLGSCVVMLVVGICLVFLPSIIKIGGESIFGSSKSSAGVKGAAFSQATGDSSTV